MARGATGVAGNTGVVMGGYYQTQQKAQAQAEAARQAQLKAQYDRDAQTARIQQQRNQAARVSAPTGTGSADPGQPTSMQAINNVVTPPPPQDAQSGQTNDVLAGLMGGQGPETPQILGSRDQVLRPLGQRMLPMQSVDVAQRGKRVY